MPRRIPEPTMENFSEWSAAVTRAINTNVRRLVNVAVVGGGGADCPSCGHEIYCGGSAVTQRGILKFTGAGVTVTDDEANDRTIVNIP